MLKSRKINNEDLYKVYDCETNEILGYYPSRREANKVIRSGGAVSASALKKMFKSSYDKKHLEVPGYTVDNELSGRRVKTYVNNDTGEVVMINRGTQGAKDVLTDMKLFFTPKSKLKKLDRFKYADNMLKKIEDKYGAENVTVTGHSLAGRIAEVIGSEKNKNIITYNKAVVPFQKQREGKNQVDIRTSLDPVSMLDKRDSNDIVLKSKTHNLLREHSLAALDDTLDDEMMIGKGLLRRLMRRGKKSTKK